MRVAPHLVRPLPFLIPIYKGVRPGLRDHERRAVDLRLARAVPRAARAQGVSRRPRRRSRSSRSSRPDGLRGALEYYDCATDDARLVLENALDAIALGAECHTYTEVAPVRARRAARITGVAVRDRLTGKEWSVQPRAP